MYNICIMANIFSNLLKRIKLITKILSFLLFLNIILFKIRIFYQHKKIKTFYIVNLNLYYYKIINKKNKKKKQRNFKFFKKKNKTPLKKKLL